MFPAKTLAAVLMVILNASVLAQDADNPEPDNEQRPEPGSVVVPVQEETDPEPEQQPPQESGEPEEKVKLGHVRIWNFVEDVEPRLAAGVRILTGSSGAQEAIGATGGFKWLNRGMRAKDLKGYIELPEGTYELVIIPETVQKFTGNDEEFRAPAADASILSPRLRLEVLGGSFSTVILRGPIASIKSETLNDNLQGAINTTLRVLNFTNATGISLEAVEGGVERALLENIGQKASLNIANAEGEVIYVLKYPGPNNSSVRRFQGVMHRKGLSFSMLIFEDRYDRLTFSVIPDGVRQ